MRMYKFNAVSLLQVTICQWDYGISESGRGTLSRTYICASDTYLCAFIYIDRKTSELVIQDLYLGFHETHNPF